MKSVSIPRLTSFIAARLVELVVGARCFINRAHAAASDLSLDSIRAETAPEHRILLFDERLEHVQLSISVDRFVQKFSGTVVLRQQRLDVALELRCRSRTPLTRSAVDLPA